MAGIPTIIHQSWKNENIPHDVYPEAWIESWKEAHPGWTYLFWTDRDNEELVRRWYPQFYDFYMGLDQGIKKADFARFLYMHRFGGVYVDLDFVCLKNLSPLLAGHDIVLGRLSPDNAFYQIANAFLASRPGCEFWLQTAADASNAPPGEQWVEALAGPVRLQWAYQVYRPENCLLCDYELIYPLDFAHFGGTGYRGDRKRLAQEARGMTPSEMSHVFPNSYCVTFWTHHW